ncbi:MAG: DUF2249 domain-containing protein [Xanthomonadaceae bacterium]|nr:DUF2249 domain-containing protein [Xanthomonadaceae bacterium]
MSANRTFHELRAVDAAWPEYDLRQLPCPEPMQRALALAGTLVAGQAVQVLTPQRPLPLLDVLQARGLQTCVSVLPDGGVCVLIRCPDRDDPTGA